MSDNTSSIIALPIWLLVVVLSLVIIWKFYAKAGQPGWASLIPFYNIVVLMRIAGRPGWWAILYFIPLINIIVAVITSIDTAKAFGKSTAFGIFGLLIFSIIGYSIIAFGNDTYTQPTHA